MKKTDEVKKDAVGTDETNVNNNTNNESTADANLNKEGEHHLAVADDVADKIVKLEEVESANVIVTDTNAYVAVVLKKGTEGTKQIENKIADEARSANAAFKNVYVSLNPDFVKQMNEVLQLKSEQMNQWKDSLRSFLMQ